MHLLFSFSTLVSIERVERPLNRLAAGPFVPGRTPRRVSPLLGYHAGGADRSRTLLSAVSSVPVVTCRWWVEIVKAARGGSSSADARTEGLR